MSSFFGFFDCDLQPTHVQEEISSVAMAYADLSENNEGPFEEIDAKDYTGSWYQAYIISKTSLHIMVHFSGSDA